MPNSIPPIQSIFTYLNSPAAKNSPNCTFVKELLDPKTYTTAAATISEKVVNIYHLVTQHTQRAYQEIKDDPSSITPRAVGQIIAGIGLTGIGLFSGYQFLKKAREREIPQAIGYGAIAVCTLISGGFVLYDQIVKFSLRPFCGR